MVFKVVIARTHFAGTQSISPPKDTVKRIAKIRHEALQFYPAIPHYPLGEYSSIFVPADNNVFGLQRGDFLQILDFTRLLSNPDME